MAARPRRTPVPGAPGIYVYYDSRDQKWFMVRYRTSEKKQTDKRGFRTLTAAKNFQAQTRVAILAGTFTPEAKKATKITALWPAFIATKQGLRPRPLRNLESAWETHVKVRWGHISVGRITRATVQEWTNELAESLSPSRVKDVVGVLRGIIQVAVHDGVIPIDPTVGVVTPAKVGKQRRRYLTPDEARTMADSLSGQLKTVFVLLVSTGLRWGEMAALTVGDVDLGRGRISIERTVVKVTGGWHYGPPKNGKRRSVPIPTHLVEPLREATAGRRPDTLLFPARDGHPLRAPRPLNDDHKRRVESGWLHHACIAAGIAYLSPHDLRHAAASLAVAAGAHILALQRMLGHSRASETLDTYADLFDSDLDDVAARIGTIWGQGS